ncbi:MAG: helix-hairpin-helix domain-containing protein [Silvibacterium sp.]
MADNQAQRKRVTFLGLATLAGCMAVPGLSGCNLIRQQSTQQVDQSATKEMKVAAASAGTNLDKIKKFSSGIEKTLSEDASTIVSGRDMVNINYASEDKLATLPGINSTQARTIMDNRPYNTPLDLVYKHVVTKEEYTRIANRVVAWDNLWAGTD